MIGFADDETMKIASVISCVVAVAWVVAAIIIGVTVGDADISGWLYWPVVAAPIPVAATAGVIGMVQVWTTESAKERDGTIAVLLALPSLLILTPVAIVLFLMFAFGLGN